MDSPPKVSGETSIVHHIPSVHCQVSGCGGSSKRTENSGLSRTTSSPESDVLQREASLYGGSIQTSSGSWSSHGGGRETGGGRGGSTASDDSSFASSNSEEQSTAAHTLPRTKTRNRNPPRRNPFSSNAEEDEDEDEEEDGDNTLHGYSEDSSFHLHSETNSASDDATAPFHSHDSGFPCEPFSSHSSGSRESSGGAASDLSNHLEDSDILGSDRERRHGSSGSNASMDCGEHDWVEDDDDEEEDHDHPMRCGRSSKTGSYSSTSSNQLCSCCGLSQQFPETFPEPFSEFQQGYGSDSSCNSSEGVLVNFSAIYNRMNNGVPEKQQQQLSSQGGPANCNGSVDRSSTSSLHQQDVSGGAFYSDLHSSPTEPPPPHQSPPCFSNNFAREPHLSSSSTCSCSMEHQGPLDANCNSFHPAPAGSSGDLASCLQSQARLVVATQNYYKSVTCDSSSQSSPSPVGSSVNSCSSEHSRGSPTPTQPGEYFLFRQRGVEEGSEEEEEEDGAGESSQRDDDDDDVDEKEEEEKKKQKGDRQDAGGAGGAPTIIEGQVYVNISPPMAQRSVTGGVAASGSRPRSRSYDRSSDRCPSPRLGSMERMSSCPVRSSESATQAATPPPPPPPPPPRVTSFAEIARSKRRHGGGSPSTKTAADPFSSTCSIHSHSSVDFSPISEQRVESAGPVTSPVRFARCYSQGSIEHQSEGAKESQTKAEGVSSSSSESPPMVVRYSKDQRPTTLPIQPFTFHHQFAFKPPQPKPSSPLLTGYVSGMQARSGSGSGSGSGGPVDEEIEGAAGNGHNYQSPCNAAAPPAESVRPSPLGSYSPVRLQGAPSSGSCSTCTPSPKPTHSLSCPLSAGLGSSRTPPASKQGSGSAALPPTPPPPSSGVKRGVVPTASPGVQGQCFHHGALHNLPALHSDSSSPSGCSDSGKHADSSKGPGTRTQNAHHLSPQASKWREYRRRNPSGVERASRGHSVGNVELRRAGGPRPARRNVFDFPTFHSGPSSGWPHVQSAKSQQSYSDFSPDYFSSTEKPPEEFCSSPDASTSSSSSRFSSQSHISVDSTQKRGSVKAVNTAVDSIVAHFGTSRDPDVKAKLGNSWVSPNVGHSISKYSCPASRDSSQDGSKAYVLDSIIGQRRCQPWSVVEASTQSGPSTRVLHSSFSKVSQFSESTSHNMRMNAFIFGSLNMKSSEFWFNHLFTHEDIIAAHYSPWGFLPLSQGACKPSFEESLLSSQPLSLLPFDSDLSFEPHLFQKGQEQSRRKEQSCSAGQPSRSTFQLMRGWSVTVSEMARDPGTEAKNGRPGSRREGTWPGMERAEHRRAEVEGQRVKGVGEEGADVKERDRRKGKDPGEERRQRGDKQAGWWYQSMQSSQVYIDQSTEGSKFIKAEKRKKSSERRQNQPPPTREGVVEGAESRERVGSSSSSGGESVGSRGRPSWMGSPPESVLNRETDANAAEDAGAGVRASSQDESPSQGQSSRWGRSFGSTVGSPQRARAEGAELGARTSKTRPPSGWLALDRSLLNLVAVSIGAGGGKKAEPPTTPTHNQTLAPPSPPPGRATETKPSSSCEVRASCHHIATEPGQSSFNKGDVSRVSRKADPDWSLCSSGATQGLVPVIYVTLNSMKDSHS